MAITKASQAKAEGLKDAFVSGLIESESLGAPTAQEAAVAQDIAGSKYGDIALMVDDLDTGKRLIKNDGDFTYIVRKGNSVAAMPGDRSTGRPEGLERRNEVGASMLTPEQRAYAESSYAGTDDKVTTGFYFGMKPKPGVPSWKQPRTRLDDAQDLRFETKGIGTGTVGKEPLGESRVPYIIQQDQAAGRELGPSDHERFPSLFSKPEPKPVPRTIETTPRSSSPTPTRQSTPSRRPASRTRMASPSSHGYDPRSQRQSRPGRRSSGGGGRSRNVGRAIFGAMQQFGNQMQQQSQQNSNRALDSMNQMFYQQNLQNSIRQGIRQGINDAYQYRDYGIGGY